MSRKKKYLRIFHKFFRSEKMILHFKNLLMNRQLDMMKVVYFAIGFVVLVAGLVTLNIKYATT